MTKPLVRRARGLGLEMRVEELGAGSTTYVMVHGYGVTSRYMRPTARLLAQSGRVLLPTMPGWRGSERTRGPLGVAALAEVLADWMRSEQLPQSIVVGNSFGCQVVAELAVRAPELVRGAVLSGPTVEPAARTFPRMIGRLIVDTYREPVKLAGIIALDYTAFGPRNCFGMGRNAMRHRVEDVLPRVGVPLLVVRGSRDALLSRQWAQMCTSLAPHASFAEIPDVGHAVNYNAPEQLARLVREFEQRLDLETPTGDLRRS